MADFKLSILSSMLATGSEWRRARRLCGGRIDIREGGREGGEVCCGWCACRVGLTLGDDVEAEGGAGDRWSVLIGAWRCSWG